jgi:D-galactarolactone cycloisomerase
MAKPGVLATDLYRSARVKIARIESRIIRTLIAVPIRTSFGIMRDRPAVFVKVTDADGAEGFGEVWCNFPSVGAEHRARLANEVIGPLLIESGELAARQAGLPLWRVLDDSGTGKIRAYASGIGPEDPAELAASAASRGHTAFKLKVGFGRKTDLHSLSAIRSALAPYSMLMADANQGWRFDDALKAIRMCADHDVAWIEEPIAADRPLTDWTTLARTSPIALAGGENINRLSDFESVIAGKIFGYLQPDVAKWGGVSGCLEAARLALGAGMIYCPHFLGSGIGLMTSAHLLAAAGGDGLLEIDVNPNPHRDALVGGALPLVAGSIQLSEAAGIGIEPDWRAL